MGKQETGGCGLPQSCLVEKVRINSKEIPV